ncbi:hypothetical protein C8R47DRAFT_1228080 [Mycena vitilis]|nr:hypothetical protein C8R47DRAFT_1228080 [Mycena vitilis]
MQSFTLLPAFLLALVSATSGATIPTGPTSGVVTALFYSPNGTVGACGNAIQNKDFAVALDSAAFKNGASCGEKIVVTAVIGGASIEAVVQDVCPECKPGDIKLTSFIQELAGAKGPIQVTTAEVIVPPPVLINGSVSSYTTSFGACAGAPISPTEFVAALSDADIQGGVECFRNVTVTLNGKNVTANVKDACSDCAAGELKLTAPAFKALTGSDSSKSVKAVWFIDTE